MRSENGKVLSDEEQKGVIGLATFVISLIMIASMLVLVKAATIILAILGIILFGITVALLAAGLADDEVSFGFLFSNKKD